MTDVKPDNDKREEQRQPLLLASSKIQYRKTTNLTPISLPKAEKRSLSPAEDTLNKKKLKIAPPNALDESSIVHSLNKDDGLKSVLVFIRNKPSKKSVSWRPETELVQVSYFEHDANERVNVNRTFKAMKMQEREIERRNFLAARKLSADNMEPKTVWRSLDDSLLIDIPETGKDKIKPGNLSHEKKKQNIREQSSLQAIYINKNMIPDSPEEPDEMEIFPYSEPLNIPFEDMSGDTEIIFNHVNIPCPGSMVEQPPTLEKMQQQQYPVSSGHQMKQQPHPIHPQHQIHQFQPHYHVKEFQWMGQPVGHLQHNQYYYQQHLHVENRPSHFENGGGSDSGGGRGHTRLECYSVGGNCDSYQGKMNRRFQRGNSILNCRGGYPGNGRVGRLCKFYANQGVCKKPNCKFLHVNS